MTILLCKFKNLSSAFKTTKPPDLVFWMISAFAIAICLMFLKFLMWAKLIFVITLTSGRIILDK